MGNAIRWLKDLIIKVDPGTGEMEAKKHILESIDGFIRERITAPATLISQTAAKRITHGDVVLVYASSSVVQKTILEAHKKGIKFRVIVVDSKPLFEGKALARRLTDHGITDIQYYMISSAAHAVKDATKVFLGAHAMLSNGRLYSRVGSAIVAMLAHEKAVPVIICAESIKFTERVALDSIVGNEVAPSEELLSDLERNALLPLIQPHKPKDDEDSKESANLHGSGGKSSGEDIIAKFRDTPNLQMLNVLYDVTPAEYINVVVTEFGSLPPSSVPVVHRLSQVGA
jgi:translation initiation factor eIF-2B subunit delta